MKKYPFGFVLVIMVIFLVYPIHAQVSLKKGFHAGLNIADLSGDDVLDNHESFKTANAGLFLQFKLLNLIALQPEINYTQRGAVFKEGSITNTVKLDYVQIPVLLKIKFPILGILPTSIFGGPSIAFNTRAKVKTEGAGSSFQVDIKDNIKDVETGAVAGVGLEFGMLMLDARYTVGLGTIDNSSDNLDIKNRVISFNAGLIF